MLNNGHKNKKLKISSLQLFNGFKMKFAFLFSFSTKKYRSCVLPINFQIRRARMGSNIGKGFVSMHCTENPIYVFWEMKRCGLIPNSYSHVHLWAIYIFPGSVCLFCCSEIGRPSWKDINRSQIHEYGNWETEHYNSVLEKTRPHSFISGNTSIRTVHLYKILIHASFAVCIRSV